MRNLTQKMHHFIGLSCTYTQSKLCTVCFKIFELWRCTRKSNDAHRVVSRIPIREAYYNSTYVPQAKGK